MITKTVDISEAQSQLSELVSFAQEGNEIIIAEGNKPLARIVAISIQPQQRIAGLNQGTIWTSEDFDEPLPEELKTHTSLVKPR